MIIKLPQREIQDYQEVKKNLIKIWVNIYQ